MTDDIVSANVPQGSEVRWYAGGTYTTETHTVTAGEVSAGGFALAGGKKADYGSVWAAKVVSDVRTPKAVSEKVDAATWATEATGTSFITYAGITAADVIEIAFVDITTALTHVATAQDISFSGTADTSSVSVHGQATKIQTTGAIENKATLNQLAYTLDFIGLVYGDYVNTSNATTPMKKFSNKTTAFRSVGCLVGKRRNDASAITRKWFLMNAQGTTANHTFPTTAKYNDSFTFQLSHYMDVILE
jgi:hypothetical protein